MKRRKWFFCALVVLTLLSGTVGWLAGLDQGYNTGYGAAHLEYLDLVRTAQAEGMRSFRVQGLPARIYPDRAEIIGVGADTPIREQ